LAVRSFDGYPGACFCLSLRTFVLDALIGVMTRLQPAASSVFGASRISLSKLDSGVVYTMVCCFFLFGIKQELLFSHPASRPRGGSGNARRTCAMPRYFCSRHLVFFVQLFLPISTFKLSFFSSKQFCPSFVPSMLVFSIFHHSRLSFQKIGHVRANLHKA